MFLKNVQKEHTESKTTAHLVENATHIVLHVQKIQRTARHVTKVTVNFQETNVYIQILILVPKEDIRDLMEKDASPVPYPVQEDTIKVIQEDYV